MLPCYVLTLIFTLIGTTFAQTSSTGKINSGTDSSGAPNQGSSGSPQDVNQGYQFNQGVQPYSYGYNTGIRPYSYSYTYPQNGNGKPQISYQNLQQPQPQQYPQMVPMQPAYYGQNGYPMQPPAYYGYPPMQPVQFQPMPMNGPQPTIPPMPELPNLGGDFDLTNLGQPSSANNQQGDNPLNEFGLLGGTNAANSKNNQLQNNGLQAPDLNSELADPSSVAGTNNANNNNQPNLLPGGVPQGLADFGIEGLGSSPTTNSNNNGNSNNNNNNNPMTGLPDILSQIGGQNSQNDFGDLANLANLANGNLANGNPIPAQSKSTSNQVNPMDFNFGGSNNNLDLNMNNLPSASNLDFDLNIPSASELKPQKIKSDKEIATTKSKKQSIKKDNNKKDNNQTDKQVNGGKKLVKNLRKRRSTDNNYESSIVNKNSKELEVAETRLQNQNDLEIDPESPRGMLNISPAFNNPYQGVYSQYPAYRLM